QSNLAEVCRAEGRRAEAERLYREVVARRETIQGVRHPDLATALGNLAGLRAERRDFAEASFRSTLMPRPRPSTLPAFVSLTAARPRGRRWPRGWWPSGAPPSVIATRPWLKHW